MANTKWNKTSIYTVIKQYKKFLYLKRKYKEDYLPPSKEIDIVWHAHILHTKRYIQFCDNIFGYYLHHNPMPNSSHVDMKKAFDNTQRLYYQEFGEHISQINHWFCNIAIFFKKIIRKLTKPAPCL